MAGPTVRNRKHATARSRPRKGGAGTYLYFSLQRAGEGMGRGGNVVPTGRVWACLLYTSPSPRD
eukprot:10867672-Alexandrium_andersonii.AAC.1